MQLLKSLSCRKVLRVSIWEIKVSFAVKKQNADPTGRLVEKQFFFLQKIQFIYSVLFYIYVKCILFLVWSYKAYYHIIYAKTSKSLKPNAHMYKSATADI